MRVFFMNGKRHEILQKFSLLIMAMLALAQILITAHAAFLSHAYLPISDILRYGEFLQLGAEGRISWNWLWERHNSIHLILLPKLIFLLDMRLTAGSGWVVVAVSALLLASGPLLFFQAILPYLPWCKKNKICFVFLSTVLMSSAVQMESLSNPINIQWSFLSFGILLTASAWVASAGGGGAEQPIFMAFSDWIIGNSAQLWALVGGVVGCGFRAGL